jgi:hypothetical protein
MESVLNHTLSNRINIIMKSNADVAQLKVLVDTLLARLLDERKIDPNIF